MSKDIAIPVSKSGNAKNKLKFLIEGWLIPSFLMVKVTLKVMMTFLEGFRKPSPTNYKKK